MAVSFFRRDALVVVGYILAPESSGAQGDDIISARAPGGEFRKTLNTERIFFEASYGIRIHVLPWEVGELW